jgi:hypothetical protein
MSPTTYSVDCPCGASVAVAATEAGSTKVCRCGRELRIPRLSQLRVASGLDPGESNVRDTIERMIRQGELPAGQRCHVSEFPTDDVLWFDVQCERAYQKGAASRRWMGLFTFLSFFTCWPIMLFMWLMYRDHSAATVERVGRDTVIGVPLRISRESAAAVKKMSQSKLKNLLRQVPIYERLLATYPEARIHPR